MIARPIHILRWLGHQLSLPDPPQQMAAMPARITIHSSRGWGGAQRSRPGRSAAATYETTAAS